MPANLLLGRVSRQYCAYRGTNNQELATCAATDLFVAPASGQYQPKKGVSAPCTLVDDGTNSGAPDHDLTGTPRPQPLGGTADIGCYEAK
jgi:hypothetical protein